MTRSRIHIVMLSLLATGCAPPESITPPNLSGTWRVQETRDCGDTEPDEYTIVVTQIGHDLSFYDPGLNATVTGTIEGDKVDLSGTYFDEAIVGVVEIFSTDITVAPEGDYASGTTTFKFTSALDSAYNCEGASILIAEKL